LQEVTITSAWRGKTKGIWTKPSVYVEKSYLFFEKLYGEENLSTKTVKKPGLPEDLKIKINGCSFASLRLISVFSPPLLVL
jgi:hypothetical protein